jgi:redox-sensing transcriptional repressor
VGFLVTELINDIKNTLYCYGKNRALLVGAGHLGKALLSCKSFDDYGLEIAAAFDTDTSLHGREINGKTIFPLEKLNALRDSLDAKSGIITVPPGVAEEVCGLLVAIGILVVWNFAPVLLNVPAHVLVQNENTAVSLAMLSKHLAGVS